MTIPARKSEESKRPQPKPGILDITPYTPGKGKAAGVKRVIKLSSNETPLGPSPKVAEALREHASLLHRYPESGVPALREAIAEVYGLDAGRIVCGAGSDELIGLLVHAYAGMGDEVLYTEHGFLMYKIYAQGAGATPVTAPEKNLRTDVDALLAKVTDRTKIVFVANPNNPTGSYISGAELARLRAGLPSHVVLGIDAAYAEYVSEKDYSNGKELVDAGDNCVMLRTFSKIYGLSSLRIGWAYCPPSIADVLHRLRSPFNVSGASVAAGIAAVKDTAFTEQARTFNARQLAWLSKELSALGLHVYPSVANFVLVEFSKDPAKNATAANAHLLSQGIIAREVAAYGLPDALRISIGLEEDNRAVVAALKTFLHG